MCVAEYSRYQACKWQHLPITPYRLESRVLWCDLAIKSYPVNAKISASLKWTPHLAQLEFNKRLSKVSEKFLKRRNSAPGVTKMFRFLLFQFGIAIPNLSPVLSCCEFEGVLFFVALSTRRTVVPFDNDDMLLDSCRFSWQLQDCANGSLVKKGFWPQCMCIQFESGILVERIQYHSTTMTCFLIAADFLGNYRIALMALS